MNAQKIKALAATAGVMIFIAAIVTILALFPIIIVVGTSIILALIVLFLIFWLISELYQYFKEIFKEDV